MKISGKTLRLLLLMLDVNDNGIVAAIGGATV